MNRRIKDRAGDTVRSVGVPAVPAALTDSGPEIIGRAGPDRGSGPAPSALAPPASCLDDGEVLAFLTGDADRQLLDRIDAHLDVCPHCFELVRAATPDAEVVKGSLRLGGLALRVGGLAGGRYQILRFVDRGGMGEVYEAHDLKLDERVALKTVLCSSGDSPHAARKLFAEVQLARRIAHRHVCRIYDLHEHHEPGSSEPPLHFLTMEFIHGEKLGKRLAHGPLSLADAGTIARQLLLGLAAAHQAGVLHLDFKSDNVMLRSGTPTLDAIVMDFGLARALDTQSRLRPSEQGQIAGSVAYMSPEQVECQPVLGAAADIYAFGVVLFEMLTGRLPFDGPSAAAMMLRRLKQAPPPPSAFRPEVPPALDDFVLTCMSREPRRRYKDAHRALEALDAISLAPSPSSRRRPRTRAFAAAAVLLASLALLAFFASQRAAPREHAAVDPGGVSGRAVSGRAGVGLGSNGSSGVAPTGSEATSAKATSRVEPTTAPPAALLPAPPASSVPSQVSDGARTAATGAASPSAPPSGHASGAVASPVAPHGPAAGPRSRPALAPTSRSAARREARDARAQPSAGDGRVAPPGAPTPDATGPAASSGARPSDAPPSRPASSDASGSTRRTSDSTTSDSTTSDSATSDSARRGADGARPERRLPRLPGAPPRLR